MSDKMNTVKSIREHDIVPVLENALNYGKPWDTLYIASLEEITELRRKVLELGGELPLVTNLYGKLDYQKLDFKRP